MKKKTFLMIACYLFSALAIAMSVVLIWLSAKTNWLLAVIVTVICILLVGCLIWYSIKYSFAVKSERNIEDKYECLICQGQLDAPFDSAYISSVLPKDKYKVITGKDKGLNYEAYIKLNEASPLSDFLVVRVEKISDLIEFNAKVNQVMLIHDVPFGSFKMVVIAVVEKADEETKKIYRLNNPYNVTHKECFCLYEEKTKKVYLGGDKELLSSELMAALTMEADSLFKIH